MSRAAASHHGETSSQAGLRFGPIGAKAAHLCIDMQCLFLPGAPWATPWLERVRPIALRLCTAHPQRTIFTRFIPPYRPEQARGTWMRFYSHWEQVTGQHADPRWFDLLPDFASLVPPARVVDKPSYSPFHRTPLEPELAKRDIDTLILSGTETDVCVLAAAIDAVDRGYRTVIARDAVCSSADDTHDALMKLYHRRFRTQIETADVAEILDAWHTV